MNCFPISCGFCGWLCSFSLLFAMHQNQSSSVFMLNPFFLVFIFSKNLKLKSAFLLCAVCGVLILKRHVCEIFRDVAYFLCVGPINYVNYSNEANRVWDSQMSNQRRVGEIVRRFILGMKSAGFMLDVGVSYDTLNRNAIYFQLPTSTRVHASLVLENSSFSATDCMNVAEAFISSNYESVAK